ncbi:MAG: amidohydrolase [Alphaproteobacteria bacterium]|nr:MAG: amidohydrolase [Alphaproteobacteria bacterium]
MRIFLISLIILLNMMAPALAATTLLVPDYILDVERGERIPGLAVVVDGNRIITIAAADSLRSRKFDRIITLSGQTLMPGLIDAHSHILLHPYDETGWNDQLLKESRAERVLRAGNHLRATLMAGFTALRDLGSEGAGYADVGIREALAKGIITGPRLIVAGRAIVVTGSYGPKGFDLSHNIMPGAEPADGNDVIRVVRDQIGKGADVVKFYADYRWGPQGQARPTFSLAEMKLIVETAKSSGRPAVAHAATPEGMRRAIMAGVQSIEHGDGGNLEIFQLMKKHGVIFCPTLAAGDAISRYRGWQGQRPFPERIITKRKVMKAALKAGVTICNGSDVGVFSHGENLRELELLVDYGMSRADSLRAATITGAELMGMHQELGQVREGYLADLIAVGGDPLRDFDVLKNIRFIMKDGVIYQD